MAILRRIVFIALLIVLMLLAAVFAYSNPQPIDLDLGFARVEQIPAAAAFAGVFCFGWLLGLLSAGIALWRSAGEKRRLRRDLQYVEAELKALRGSS